MVVIGHDISDRLDVIPAQYQVLVTRRPKLACRACEGVVVPAKELLGDHAGLLQCDGCAAYKSVSSSSSGGPTLAFCWAHVRREFFDLSKGGTAPIATEAHRAVQRCCGRGVIPTA